MWPEGRPYALCLTHDVDRVRKRAYHYAWYALRGGRDGRRAQWRSLSARLRGREPYWNFESIMELEQELGVRSTVLFLNESARGMSPKYWGRYDIRGARLGGAIRALAEGGWEIGLHGSYHSYDDADLLRHEKEVLEDIAGVAVRSTRQHYLRLDPERTWRIQASIGLEVDSTLGFADRVWEDAGSAIPRRDEASGILQLPVSVMDTVGLPSPEVREQAHALLDRIRRAGGLIVLDWHQRTFAPFEYLDAVRFYVDTVERGVRDGAFIATMGEIADHWRTRP